MMNKTNKNAPMFRALRGEIQDTVPVWFMRQAGRYLPEYREVRKQTDFWGMCRTPDYAIEVMMQPYRRFPLDAVILFSDILTFLPTAGFDVEFRENIGPVVTNPFEWEDSRAAEVLKSKFPPLDMEGEFSFIGEILRGIRSEIREDTAVIGFCGAPFTVASYIVEGGTSKKFSKIRRLMVARPDLYHQMMEKLTDVTIQYAVHQVEQGADFFQLFDSWAGVLHPRDYREFCAPYNERVLAALKEAGEGDGPGTILYIGNSGGLLEELYQSRADVLSLDYRVDLNQVKRAIRENPELERKCWQGNLDPLVLQSTPELVEKRTRDILELMADNPRYIFNLGTGILPQTPVENVEKMLETVKNFKRG